MRYALFCGEDGKVELGSDAVLCFDGRWGIARCIAFASQRRESYRKNFPLKHAAFTHFAFVPSLRVDPPKGSKLWAVPEIAN